MSDETALRDYLRKVEADLSRNLESGRATEHTYRPHLKALLDALAAGYSGRPLQPLASAHSL